IRATLPCSWFMLTWFRPRLWFASGQGPAKDSVFRPIWPEKAPDRRVWQDLANEPLPDGEDRRGCPIRHAELLEDAAHLRLDRLPGYPQPPRDLLVGEAFDHELKPLLLPPRQHLRCCATGIGRTAHEAGRYVRVQSGPAPVHVANGSGELV